MKKAMTRRIIQYLIGLMLMALAVVLTKRSALGLSPFSAAPAAVTEVTGISLGVTTIIFHLLCLVVIIIVIRKITLKAVLTLGVAFAFGFMVDFLMMFIGPVTGGFLPRLLVNVVGIFACAMGIVLIVGADLMLPSPDAMLRCISVVYKKSYPLIKNIGDIFWVVLAMAIELTATGRLTSVGVGTVLSAILTGRLVKLFTAKFPVFTIVNEARV